MDRKHASTVIASVVASVQASAKAVSASIRAATVSGPDGRSFKTPSHRQWSIRTSQFPNAEQNQACWGGWYFTQFRCSKSSFDRIVELISENWHAVNPAIGWNARYTIRWRVAVALHYFAHSGSIVDSANAFGMSKSSAWRFIEDVVGVLIGAIGRNVIKLPETEQEWVALSDGFESICGFPDTCLAIDGVLFEIERPFDSEGWYCRKGHPAINALVAVDYDGKIRDYALRPGSENGKGVYNRSEFGKTIHTLLPAGKVIVADAGYQLFTHCMTPYPIDIATKDERRYNYLHSTTRNKVEQTFGKIKNRFRIFKAPLAQRGNINNGEHEEQEDRHGYEQAARIIRSCFILHNIFCDLHDEVQPEPPEAPDNEEMIEQNRPAVAGSAAKARRDAIKLYLSEKATSRD